ncbi:MAG: DUF3343 domain-containing protein [Desulfarculus sp.]|nr:DUF3343 domain-containing protein [Desulfarculus sp.]
MAFAWLKNKAKPASAPKNADKGLLVFDNTSEVIRAEGLLKRGGWSIRVMGPPPEIRTGCDLVIEFPLIEKLDILRALEEAKLTPLSAVPVSGPLLEPVNLFQVKDFGQHLMVRAANMKLTIDKRSLIIVNISGGGCPDVPYLADQLVGKLLTEAPSPRRIGHTLCGYALELAYQEMRRRC